MKTVHTIIQAGAAGIGALLGWYLGGLDGFIYALIAFVVLDYITGVMRAVLDRELSSRVGFRGIFKKILIFLLVGVAHLADAYLLSDGNALRTAVIFFYISNEGISLLENSVAIGLPVPKKLRDVLVQLHKKSEDGGEP